MIEYSNKTGVHNNIELQDARIMQNKHVVLYDVNFSISQGEFVYLIGKVGSGKSSLLKTIYNELPLQEGYGTVLGYNLRTVKKKKVPTATLR